jgi:exosortase/archaeosortase
LLDNTVLFETAVTSIFYLPFQTLNFLRNNNATFTAEMKGWFLKQIKKSELVSNDNERIRIKLMNTYTKSISEFMKP